MSEKTTTLLEHQGAKSFASGVEVPDNFGYYPQRNGGGCCCKKTWKSHDFAMLILKVSLMGAVRFFSCKIGILSQPGGGGW